MTELERIKLAVKTLVSLGVAKNQEELGKLMGYSNKSSFSQVLNGIVPMPDNFIDRLCKLDKRLRRAWIVNEFGHILIKKEDSKQVYIDEGIDIDKYEIEKEIERQKKYPYGNDFQYKELAEARLEIIDGLKREKAMADKIILSLEKELEAIKELNQDKSKSSHIVANVTK
ncbi:helix-turn-helix domain-containing protein [Flavobacterium branchiophilum]|uniref:Uncharacterized protein n=1 Tax=Flavobacterium branchiophilum TaxID=55197 RepID=A0A2H3K8I0_9FLAO|nr:helix-turn-helix domain-containing protein [Flavobacterium branchiophilum]PDS21900.1 hypothetical protein B0A77_14800 [Flavobacterium branchiophilum]